jgi:radical SAM superfamily enzyme YgiQ (UPF0313 family)
MKRTVHFVQVNDIIGNNVILPLAIGVLWQYSQLDSYNREHWQLGEIVYKKLDSNSSVEKLAQGHMVVFSTYVWNSSYHFELAQRIKHINPDIFIVMGGPNISPNKRNFWDQYTDLIDLALVGEGEHSFSQLLQQWPNLQNIPGAWTKDFQPEEAPRVQDFPYEASPYLAGFYDRIVESAHQNGNGIQAVIQTNRGCPYHCTFCEEGRDYKNKMYFYNIQRVEDEIKWCAQHGISFLSIADDNWGIVAQDVEIMKLIRDYKLTYGFPDVVDATFAKNNPENLLAMARLDHEHNTRLLRGITIALQSQNTKTLSSIRRFNLIPDRQQQLIAGLKELNIPTYVEMIWPLPYETYDSFLSGIDQTINMGLNNWLGVYPLSMHYGTELYEDFHDKFSIIEQQSENANRSEQIETVPIVRASEWVDTKTIVQGQVFYNWLVCIYYFGFGRKSIEHLQSQNSVTSVVKQFIEWAKDHPETTSYKWNQLMTHWWESWLNGHPLPALGIYSEDTTHWSPYTHMASWIQHDWEQFYQEWNTFLQTVFAIELHDQYSAVRYGHTYSDLGHTQPEFNSEYEFCRFYYWWRRKQGLSRL